MQETDTLHSLIKSLTKSEKAYFRKYAKRHVIKGQNKYALLFDAIDSSSNGYDEKQIKSTFHDEGFVKNFSVMKKYLVETLLKSLSSFYSLTGPDNELKNEISYIEILYRKALFQTCAKILNRLLKQAYKRDNFLVILELLKWKKNLIHEGAYAGNDFINLEKAHTEEQNVITKIKNLSDYRMLSYRMRSILVGTNPHIKASEIKKELHEILNDPLLNSEEHALSYPALITYYHILANIYDYLKKDFEAFESRKSLINAMESHPDTIKENPANYIVSVYNILGTCLNLKLYDELQFYIDKLRTLEKVYSRKISDNDRMFSMLGSSIYEVRMHINKGEFIRGLQSLAELESGLRQFHNKMVKSDVLYIYFLIAYGYFGAGKFIEALEWINKILNDKDTDRNSRLYTETKIFNLIVHYELENFDLLDYLVRSAYRFFEKSTSEGKDERIVVQYFKRLPEFTSKAQLTAFFEEFLNHLKTTSRSSQLNNEKSNRPEPQTNFTSIAEFDLESWLESKIADKKFADIIKEKHAR